MAKRGKQIKSYISYDYNIVFGTINNDEPKAIYTIISGWMNPKDDTINNYNSIVKGMEKNIKFLTFDKISEKYHELINMYNIIVDLDIRESGIKYGKQSYMNCEVTFFNKKILPLQHPDIIQFLNDISKLIIYNVFDNSEYFTFQSKKS